MDCCVGGHILGIVRFPGGKMKQVDDVNKILSVLLTREAGT